MKVLDSVTYKLDGEEDTSEYGCEDQCTYRKTGEPNAKYCFAVGDNNVQCKSK